MNPIDQFIERYTREYDFYDQAARLAARTIEAKLQEAGIRAIVTSRAKSVSRLREKCIQRNSVNAYEHVDAIYDDIADLAGVRVALYFPGEQEQVDSVISRIFDSVSHKRVFPAAGQVVENARFSGYSATHYRVTMKEDSLPDSEHRYSAARIEIQVASVLMHAWAEVNHDLAYKPLSGKLSDTEHAILDQLNGLVLAGEIALEQLQRVGQSRVGRAGVPFANHYDLANFLLGRISVLDGPQVSEAGLGRMDRLFTLMSELGVETPDQLEPHLEGLHDDFERRPLADQVIDALLGDDVSRQLLFLRSTVGDAHDRSDDNAMSYQLGEFLREWQRLERRLIVMVPGREKYRSVGTLLRDANQRGVVDRMIALELDDLRRLRNHVVHGTEYPSLEELREATQRLALINDRLG